MPRADLAISSLLPFLPRPAACEGIGTLTLNLKAVIQSIRTTKSALTSGVSARKPWIFFKARLIHIGLGHSFHRATLTPLLFREEIIKDIPWC